MEYQDLTEDDEYNLPLPQTWKRIPKENPSDYETENDYLYQNTTTGMISDEHPLILKALQAALKKPLPFGWTEKEIFNDEGSLEQYYFNAELGISMWDHPTLRTCLFELLISLGYNPSSLTIDFSHQIRKKEQKILSIQQDQYYDRNKQIVNNKLQQNLFSEETKGDRNQKIDDIEISDVDESDNSSRLDLNELRLSLDQEDNMDKSTISGGNQTLHSIPSAVNNAKNWEQILSYYEEQKVQFSERLTHRIRTVKPPETISGLKILRSDVMEANYRIHELLLKLRGVFVRKEKQRYTCEFHEDNGERTFITLASDIVTTLRQKPEFIILAMSNLNKPNNPAMVEMAFISLHRLLHPFSTDNSMTTAILLQGINYQLDEMTLIEPIFSDMDSKVILARALFISDPVIAIRWDPLSFPLPVLPRTQSETVLSCLLRMYAIRYDVTSYFRSIWKPVFPSIVALLNTFHEKTTQLQQLNPLKNGHPRRNLLLNLEFANNLLSVANRLLECTFSEKSIIIFPSIATAICRAIQEIGGRSALNNYILNFLILPNLLKILIGDHESVENEEILKTENVFDFTNKYYDSSFWFEEGKLPSETEENEGFLNKKQLDPLNPIKGIIWLIWKLYSTSAYMNDLDLTVLTCKDFTIGAGFPASMIGENLPSFLDADEKNEIKKDKMIMRDKKLRNMIARLKRKMEKGLNCMLEMPLDLLGSDYFGLNVISSSNNSLANSIDIIDKSPENVQLLDKRLTSLHFKPNELLNLTIVAKTELNNLFTDVGIAMEIHQQTENSILYEAISEYLGLISLEEENEKGIEFLQLSFLYASQDKDLLEETINEIEANEGNNGKKKEIEIKRRYNQLLRGLNAANRYEDVLIRMVYRAQNDSISNIYELINHKKWFISPEFETEIDEKKEKNSIANKHTEVSKYKIKQSNYGLIEDKKNIPIIPLFSNHVNYDLHPNIKSLKSMQKDIIDSYRFGSAASCVNVGTSLGRNLVFAPKINPKSINVTNADLKSAISYSKHAKYTKITLNPKSNLLAPTEAFKNSKNPLPENEYCKDGKFMKSMRDHKVIPAHEFQARVQRRRQMERNGKYAPKGDEYSLNTGRLRSKNEIKPSPKTNSPNTIRPFPEHLRHLIRSDSNKKDKNNRNKMQKRFFNDEYEDYEGDFDSNNNDHHFFNSSQRRVKSENFENYDKEENVVENPENFFQDLIQEYQFAFGANVNPVGFEPETDNNYHEPEDRVKEERGRSRVPNDRKQTNQNNRSLTPTSEVRRVGKPRSRSRSFSRSVSPGSRTDESSSSRYMAPTRAHLERVNSRESEKDTRSTVLRSYPPNEAAYKGDTPFSPTCNHIYPTAKSKKYPLPAFLQSGENNSVSDSGSVKSRKSYNSRHSSPSQRLSSQKNRKTLHSTITGGETNGPLSHLPAHTVTAGDLPSPGKPMENPITTPYKPIQIEEKPSNYSNRFDFDSPLEKSDSHVLERTPGTYLSDDDFGHDEDDVAAEIEPIMTRIANLTKPAEVPLDSPEERSPAANSPSLISNVWAHTSTPETESAVIDALLQENLSYRNHINVARKVKSQPLNSADKYINVDSNSRINKINLTPKVVRGDGGLKRGFVRGDSGLNRDSSGFNSGSEGSLTSGSSRGLSSKKDKKSKKKRKKEKEERKKEKKLKKLNNLNSKTFFNDAMENTENKFEEEIKPVEHSQDFSRDSSQEDSKEFIAPKIQEEQSKDYSIGSLTTINSPINDKKDIPETPIKPIETPKEPTKRPQISKADSFYSFKFSPEDSKNQVHDLNKDYEEAVEGYKKKIGLDKDNEISIEEHENDHGIKYIDFFKDDDPRDRWFKRNSMSKSVEFKENEQGNSKTWNNIPMIKRKAHIRTKAEVKRFLIQGFRAVKHGRSGKPKMKIISYVEEEDLIQWQATKRNFFSFMKNPFSSRNFEDSPVVEEKFSSISLDDIIEVRRGIQTEVLMKAGLVDPCCCISIVTMDRTLDLTLRTSMDRDMVIRGLQLILEGRQSVRFL